MGLNLKSLARVLYSQKKRWFGVQSVSRSVLGQKTCEESGVTFAFENAHSEGCEVASSSATLSPAIVGENLDSVGDEIGERVLLIHGLGGNRLCMSPIKWALDRKGFSCAIWTYSSFCGSIESHGVRLRKYIECEFKRYDRVHFVGHSLGAIIVRSAFGSSPPQNLGRTVFLAPPNSGSPAAELASRIARGRCQTIADLSNRRESYVNRLPGWVESELGIIAANSDSVVPFGSTRLANQSEHVVVRATHSGLLISPKVMRLTARFLKCGHFGTGDL